MSSKVSFNIGEGGLGRDQANTDNYSGMIFDSSTTPSGITDGVLKVRTLAAAESAGITEADYPVAHYQISEFFRIAGVLTSYEQGYLWLMFFDGGTDSVNYDGSQLETMQRYAGGTIKRIGVFLKGTFATSFVTDSQDVADSLATGNMPLSVVIAADFTATTLSALTNLRTLASPRVCVVISQDLGGTGGALATSEGYSVACLGVALACKAFGNTHECIGWINKYDVIDEDTELDTIQFATGEAYTTQDDTVLEDLNDYGYLFLYKETGYSGTFFYDSPTCTDSTSDYAYWENQEVIDKAIRAVRLDLIPLVNSPLYLAADTGELNEATIQKFKTAASAALDDLAQDGNISVKESGSLPDNSVIIDPDQDVLSTSTITVTIKIVPVGTAREIVVNIGFTTSIS